MKNIFSLLPQEFLLRLPIDEERMMTAESIFQIYAPIDGGNFEISPLMSPQKWRARVQDVLANKSPQEIAVLAINAGRVYFEFPSAPTPYLQNQILDQFLEMNNLKNSCVTNELTSFLVLSYFYRYSHSNPPEVSDRHNRDSSLTECFNILANKEDALYRRKDNFCRQASLFKEVFLSAPGKNSFDIQTPYDLELLECMLSSLRKNCNPFVLSQRENQINFDVKSILNRYERMDFPKDNSILRIDEALKDTVYEDYPKASFPIYNQWLLERLTAVNFLCRYQALREHASPQSPLFSALESYVTCPLLDFRMRLLDFHESRGTIFYDKQSMELWCHYLTLVLNQLLRCTLPVLDLTFHYFMALRYRQKIQDAMGKTQSSFRKQQSLHKLVLNDMKSVFLPTSSTSPENFPVFYTSHSKYGLRPNRASFPNDKILFSSELYLRFFNATKEHSRNGFWSNEAIWRIEMDRARWFRDVMIYMSTPDSSITESVLDVPSQVL